MFIGVYRNWEPCHYSTRFDQLRCFLASGWTATCGHWTPITSEPSYSLIIGAMTSSTNPKKQQHQLNYYLDFLTTEWGVDIPIPEGPSSPSKIAEISPRGHKCLNNIEFLYWNAEDFLRIAINDFTREARALESGWNFKPLQDRGTLPGTSRGQRLQELLMKHMQPMFDQVHSALKSTRPKSKWEAQHGQPASLAPAWEPAGELPLQENVGLSRPADRGESNQSPEGKSLEGVGRPENGSKRTPVKKRSPVKPMKQQKLIFPQPPTTPKHDAEARRVIHDGRLV